MGAELSNSDAQQSLADRNDARGIAQMMRAGLYRPVHVKTLLSQKLRMLLTHSGHDTLLGREEGLAKSDRSSTLVETDYL